MQKSICGANCAECPSRKTCKGCAETKGCPFEKQCFIAKYILIGGKENYSAFKQGLIGEINSLNIEGMKNISELYPLVGNFINLEYPLPNGNSVKLLSDNEVYLGAQVENPFDGTKCFGIIARESFLLVCEYEKNGANPEIIIYKRR